jgi:hypothetical protein
MLRYAVEHEANRCDALAKGTAWRVVVPLPLVEGAPRVDSRPYRFALFHRPSIVPQLGSQTSYASNANILY